MHKLVLLLASLFILSFSTATKVQAVNDFSCAPTSGECRVEWCNCNDMSLCGEPPATVHIADIFCSNAQSMGLDCGSIINMSCDNLAPTPTPDPNLTPTPTITRFNCITDHHCEMDYEGTTGIPGDVPIAWDVYNNCGYNTIPYCMTNSASGEGIFCDGDKTMISTPFGCLPFTGGDENQEAARILIQTLANWAVGIGSGIALFLILFASLQIATGSGDPKRIKAGQELLFSGLAGMFLITLSIVILNFLGVKILGLNLLGFFI